MTANKKGMTSSYLFYRDLPQKQSRSSAARAARHQSIGSKSLAGCLQSGQMKSAGSVSPS